MTRRIPNLLTLLSLLVCVAAPALWVGSYMDRHFVSHRGRLYVWGLRYPAGVKAGLVADGLTLEGQRYAKPLRPILVQEQNGDTGGAPITDDPPRLRLLGASLWFGDAFGPAKPGRYFPEFAMVRFWLLAMPYRLLVIAGPILPTTAAACALRRTCRRRQNRCASCGYDLRGSFDRCPECGEKGSR